MRARRRPRFDGSDVQAPQSLMQAGRTDPEDFSRSCPGSWLWRVIGIHPSGTDFWHRSRTCHGLIRLTLVVAWNTVPLTCATRNEPVSELRRVPKATP